MKSRLIRPVLAGLVYATLAFGAGCALGALRALLVVPRAGPTVAVLLELPVILGASWWISRTCAARFQVSRTGAARLVMGAVALAVLTLAELTLSVALFGRPVAEHLVSFTTVPGAIGLAGQLAFGGIPLVQAKLASPAAGR